MTPAFSWDIYEVCIPFTNKKIAPLDIISSHFAVWVQDGEGDNYRSPDKNRPSQPVKNLQHTVILEYFNIKE